MNKTRILRRSAIIFACAIPLIATLSTLVTHGWLAGHPGSLAVDQVLNWRLQYNDLLGKDERAAMEKLGKPDRTTPGWISYFPRPQTGYRKVDLLIENQIIQGVRVIAGAKDILDVEQVIQRAPVLCFVAGTYTDSTRHFLQAQTVDGRNSLQFTLGERSVLFHAAMFRNDGPRCDPNILATAVN